MVFHPDEVDDRPGAAEPYVARGMREEREKVTHECCLTEEESAVVWAAVGEVDEDEDGGYEDVGSLVGRPVWLC